MQAKILALKSFFMEEIYDLTQEILSVRSQLNKKDSITQKIMIAWEKRRTIIKRVKRQITFMPDRISAIKRRN